MRAVQRLGSLLAVGLAILSAAYSARADESAAAQALFDQGRAAMAGHRSEEACPKFAESLRLEYALGTLLNLASCYEQQGKIATAWSKYLELAGKGRDDRAKVARQRAAVLAQRLSKLTIVVPASERVQGLEVKRDGTVIGEAEWGTPLPVDPGPHTIEATAPGRQTWSTTVQVSDQPTTPTVTVPELPPLAAPALASRSPLESTPTPAPSTVSTPSSPAVDSGRSKGLGTQRVLALVSGAIGVAGIGVGAYFGVVSMGKHHDTQNASAMSSCTPMGGQTVCYGADAQKVVDLAGQARTAGDASTVGFIVGAAGLAGAGLLWFIMPKQEQTGLTAQLGVGAAALQLRATW